MIRLMHCSTKPIQNVLTNYDFETFQGRDSRRTYKRKTTKQKDRYIEQVIKQNYDVPLKDITNNLNVNISQSTIQRQRSEAGLESYIAAVKPGLIGIVEPSSQSIIPIIFKSLSRRIFLKENLDVENRSCGPNWKT